MIKRSTTTTNYISHFKNIAKLKFLIFNLKINSSENYKKPFFEKIVCCEARSTIVRAIHLYIVIPNLES